MIKGEGDERSIWAELEGERTGGVEEEEIAGFVVAGLMGFVVLWLLFFSDACCSEEASFLFFGMVKIPR